MVFQEGDPTGPGIALLRLAPLSPETFTEVLRALAGRDNWSGYFSVIEPDRVRMTQLPERTSD